MGSHCVSAFGTTVGGAQDKEGDSSRGHRTRQHIKSHLKT